MLGVDLKTLVTGAIALSGLVIIVTNATGFATITKALSGGTGVLLNSLQGRGTAISF